MPGHVAPRHEVDEVDLDGGREPRLVADAEARLVEARVPADAAVDLLGGPHGRISACVRSASEPETSAISPRASM